MKPVIAVVAVAALGAVAATVVVGVRVREETVVAHPYEEGLQQDACDVGAGPCTRPLPGGGEVTLELSPRPLRTMQELAVVADVRRGGAPVDGASVSVSFAMRGMGMGPNRSALGPAGSGRYAGKAVLVRCPSGRKDWVADVTVSVPGGTGGTAPFELAVAP